MSLARVKTWNPGDVLTAADLNGEFNNVLNNPISLVSPTTGPINFNLQAHTGLLPSVFSGTSGIGGNLLVLTTAATPVSVWAGSAMQGSRVMGLVGVLSSQSGTFTADQYVMQSSSGFQSWVVTATSSFAASVGTAGPAAGGRDIAAAFGSTYVHWYAISTGPGSTAPAAIVSTATPPVGPVLPTGYTGWTYLGASVYTSASTTVGADHRFEGHEAHYSAQQSVLTNGNTTAANTAVPIGNVVPSNAKRYQLQISYNTADPSVQSVSIGHVSGANYSLNILANSALSGPVMRFISMPQASTQFFYTLSTGFVAALDSLQGHVLSYSIPNGDV